MKLIMTKEQKLPSFNRVLSKPNCYKSHATRAVTSLACQTLHAAVSTNTNHRRMLHNLLPDDEDSLINREMVLLTKTENNDWLLSIMVCVCVGLGK